jgi:hypothetical protein
MFLLLMLLLLLLLFECVNDVFCFTPTVLFIAATLPVKQEGVCAVVFDDGGGI